MTVRESVVSKGSLAAANRIVSNLRFSASGSALQKAGRAPQIRASIITAEVKDNSSQANVSRLRLTLKEEGVPPENSYRPGSATDGVDEGHPFAEGLPWLSLVDTNSHGEGRGGWLSGRGSRRV